MDTNTTIIDALNAYQDAQMNKKANEARTPLIDKSGKIVGYYVDRAEDINYLIFEEVQGQFKGFPYEVYAWDVEYIIDMRNAESKYFETETLRGHAFTNVNSFYRLIR